MQCMLNKAMMMEILQSTAATDQPGYLMIFSDGDLLVVMLPNVVMSPFAVACLGPAGMVLPLRHRPFADLWLVIRRSRLSCEFVLIYSFQLEYDFVVEKSSISEHVFKT